MIVEHIIKRVFGDEYKFSIPSGPALVYFYRRFGFTKYGSDAYKQLCRYVLKTAVDGLYVSFLFGGTNCYIHGSMTDELMFEYEQEERRPLTEWWKRCSQWALAQGEGLLVEAFEDLDLFIEQAEAWLTTQGVTEEITEEEFIKAWSEPYSMYRSENNGRIRDAYEQIEPFLEVEENQSEIGQRCETAVEAVLLDLLRPVSVRDVYINVLGEVDPGEWDEETERYDNQPDEPISFMAGYGVVTEVYKDFDLYLEFLDAVREHGDGDLLAGMRTLLKGGRVLCASK